MTNGIIGLILSSGLMLSHGAVSAEREPECRNDYRCVLMDGGALSSYKIDQYLGKLVDRKSQLLRSWVDYYEKYEGKSHEKALKKAKKEKELEVYDILIARVRQLSSFQGYAFDREAERIMEIDYALRISGPLASFRKTWDTLKALSEFWSIRKQDGKREASNLVDPETGRVLSIAQVMEMKATGQDLSLLDPPSQGEFWVKPQDIASINLEKYYGNAEFPMFEGVKIHYPSGETEFSMVRKTQSKPKIDVKFKGEDGKKHKIKFKVGKEVYSDITASALMVGLGYHADHMRYTRDFRINLGDIKPNQFKQDWLSYFDSFDPDDYIKEEGKDAQGHYLVFHEGMLEIKPKPLVRVGPWAYGEHGHRNRREVRGLLLLNMWINNSDLKESINNKLVLKEDGNTWDSYLYQHDNGFAFGHFLRETVANFKWSFIDQDSEKIKFHFHQFQRNTGFDHVSYYDYKWMARKIAQYTREQIEQAVRLGGWPKPVQMLLVEKLISRRNEIVKAFDLLGDRHPDGAEIKLIEYDRHVSSGDGALVNGELVQTEFPGYVRDFGHEIREIVFDPVKDLLRDVLVELASTAVEGVANVEYDEFGPELVTDDFVKVFGSLKRNIKKNPKADTIEEAYIVEDILDYGVGLGVGVVYQGYTNFHKRFRLIYTVKSQREARLANGFLVNLKMAGDLRDGELPANHILIAEEFIEGGGRLQSDVSVGPGIELGASRVYLNRLIVNRKDPSRIGVTLDDSVYNKVASKLYVKLAALRLPLGKFHHHDGELSRKRYYMDRSIVEDKRFYRHLLKSIDTFDLNYLEGLKADETIESKFTESALAFNFLRLVKFGSLTRQDHLEINNEDGVTYQDQGRSMRYFDFRFSDIGERYEKRAFYVIQNAGTLEEKGHLELDLMLHDNNTKTIEFSEGMIGAANRIALDDQFFAFRPEDHSENERWSALVMNLKIKYFHNAVDRILNLSSDKFWDAMAVSMGITRSELDNKLLDLTFTHSRDEMYTSLEAGEEKLLNKAQAFMRRVRKARRTSKISKRIRKLTKAFRDSLVIKREGLDPTILESVHRIVGFDDTYMKTLIESPVEFENTLPVKALYSDRGVNQNMLYEPMSFSAFELDELYHMF